MISRTTLIAILFLAPAAFGQDAPEFDCHGDPLPPGAVAHLGTVQFRGNAYAMAFSPSGTLATITGHCEFTFIDPVTGTTVKSWKPEKRFGQTPGPARDLAFSPDGKLLASAEAWDLRLQNLVTGKTTILRAGVRDQIHDNSCVVYSPDGSTLATAGRNPTIVLWNAKTGKLRHKIVYTDKDGNDCGSRQLAFSPDGKWLSAGVSVGGRPYYLALCDATRGVRVNQIRVPEAISAVAFAPDNKTVAASCHDKIFVYDMQAGEKICTLPGHKAETTFVAFTPDGTHLISGGVGQAIIWNVRIGYRKEHEFRLAGARYHSAFALSRDGKTLAMHWNGAIRFVDVATGRGNEAPPGHEGHINAIAWSPDAGAIATASSDNTIRVWNATKGRALNCYKEMRATTALAFRRDGKALISLGDDHTVRVRSVPGGHVIQAFTTREFRSAQSIREEMLDQAQQRWRRMPINDTVLISVLSPDGGSVATAYGIRKPNCVLWNTKSAEPTRSFHMERWNWSMAFRPDGAGLLAIVGSVTSLERKKDANAGHLHDVSTGRSLYAIHDDDPTPYLGPRFVLSPDGVTLIFRERTTPPITILNVKTGKRIERVPLEIIGQSLHTTFSPDGSIVAVCENDRELGYRTHLIEMLTGQEIRCLNGAGWVGCMAFSPDSRKLVTASDTAPLVWEVIPPCDRDVDETVWRDLGGDVTQAYRAIAACLDAPTDAVPFLAQRLHPVAHVETKTVDTWISNLGHPNYAIREKATTELRSLGTQPERALRKLLDDNPPLEIRRRIQQILNCIEDEWRPTPAELRVMRGIQILESIGSDPARQILATLADGAPGARFTTAARQALTRANARAGVAQ